MIDYRILRYSFFSSCEVEPRHADRFCQYDNGRYLPNRDLCKSEWCDQSRRLRDRFPCCRYPGVFAPVAIWTIPVESRTLQSCHSRQACEVYL